MVGRPRLPALLFPLGAYGPEAWLRLDEVAAVLGPHRLDEAMGPTARLLWADRPGGPMPREIALVSAERVTLADVLEAAARVDDCLAPRAVLGGWAVQLVDRDDVVVLTVEQSRRLDQTSDVARILGEDAPTAAAWWTEATAPWGRAGERGVRVARAIAQQMPAGSGSPRVTDSDRRRPVGDVSPPGPATLTRGDHDLEESR